MPILDIQQRLREIGRIRMGDKVSTGGDKTRPNRLDKFRLTSADRTALEAAAICYGGEVRPWAAEKGQFELYIQAEEIPVVVSPIPVDQWLEQWSAGGCTHRCDGCVNQITDEDCSCDRENPTDKKAHPCKPTTRVSLMLPDLPSLGVWRLESHGYYAATELPTSVQLLRQGAQSGEYIPATLAIEQRKVVRKGETKIFPVPVLRLRRVLSEMLSIRGGEAKSLDRPAAAIGTGAKSLPAGDPVQTTATTETDHQSRVAAAAGETRLPLPPEWTATHELAQQQAKEIDKELNWSKDKTKFAAFKAECVRQQLYWPAMVCLAREIEKANDCEDALTWLVNYGAGETGGEPKTPFDNVTPPVDVQEILIS